MRQIPNLFTLLNLVFGCIAIIFVLQTGEMIVTESDNGTFSPQLPEKIWWGSVFIGLAAIVDFLDGFVARLFRATSDMGKQLDSLADVVSFGAAPGIILYQLLRISFIQEEDGLDTSIWALLPALLFPVATAWRLARFNIDNNADSDFRGVPCPAAGLFVASLPLIIFYNYFNINIVLVNKWTLYAITIVLSGLMVSKARFMALKFGKDSAKSHLPKIILVIIAIIAAVFLQWLAVPVVFIVYLILSQLITTNKKIN
ncbi:MAG: CDP-alcohol phosphatidyltransferase family protein [Chitinophagaceae bacterium]|nr:CDP-alcohol phosphatidyltransferase family protein [Chitinophagaceae bacterium]